MFSFFLKSYREGLLTFGGEGVDVYFDINGPEGKETIRRYENGQYKNTPILTKHPNIVKGVITGKKSFGLHVRMWSEGISDWCFTKEEILEDFKKKNVLIPKQLSLDFDNWIEKMKKRRYT
jgi:hypothetical protein